MKKIIISLVAVLVVLISGLLIWLFQKNNAPDTTEIISSEQAAEEYDNVRETFWMENDRPQVVEEFKQLAYKLQNQNIETDLVSEESLQDEEVAMIAYAKNTFLLDPQEGFKIYADIYHNDRYSSNTKSRALFEAMELLNERIRTVMTYNEAKLWAFSSGHFDDIFQEAETTPDRIGTKYELVEVALFGMKKADTLNTSWKRGAMMAAAVVQLDVAFEATKFEERYEIEKLDGESLSAFEIRIGDRGNLDALYQDTIDVETNTRNLMSDNNTYPAYAPTLVKAVRNITRTYLRLQQHGFDVYPKMVSLQNFLLSYIKNKSSQFDEPLQYETDYEVALNSLLVGCVYILANEGTVDIEEVKSIVEPFVLLPKPHRGLMYGVSRVGELKEGVCYDPYVLMGQLDPEFKRVLIDDVGGWEEEQFQ